MTTGRIDLKGDVHRRYNPLTDEWVLVSPHRTGRPWQGQTEAPAAPPAAAYDPDCYLCPGNVRAGGLVTPRYESTFVFDNDFPALLPAAADAADVNVAADAEAAAAATAAAATAADANVAAYAEGAAAAAAVADADAAAAANVAADAESAPDVNAAPDTAADTAAAPTAATRNSSVGHLLRAQGEAGRCRVICYSPLHHLTLGQMPLAGIRQVIDAWTAEYQSLGAHPRVNAVTIFENRGPMMGASNPHPHGQIWANETLPDMALRESLGQRTYRQQRGSCLLCDYAALEVAERERVVCANAQFVAVVPFWAVWPFETLVLPRTHAAALDELDAGGRDSFAHILKDLTARYDALFSIAFPYTMGLHQRPTDGRDHPQWHLHAHFYPPLLRSASVRKFMVGYEMLAGPQRDITAEAAAARLRGDSR